MYNSGTSWRNGPVAWHSGSVRALKAISEASGSDMNVLDLLKATIGCGLTAYLIYSFPVIGQVLIITILSLLWLSYAHRALIRRR